MPDSETESKHFFRIFGTFSKKVFRLQLFVSIVGLAEAVPAGSNGQLDLATPERRRGRVQSTAPRSRDVGQEPLPERPFLMVGRRQGATWAAEGQWLRPSRSWVQWIKHPDRFLRFIPKEPDLLQDFPELNLSEPGRVDQKPHCFLRSGLKR